MAILTPQLVFPIPVQTDAAKYRYLYAALEQLRLKHNERAGDTSPEANYFRREWKIPQRKVLKGILLLRPKLRTPDWHRNEDEDIDPAFALLRGEGKVGYKSADYKALTGDDLDAVSGSLELPDPLEDYTTYTQVDPNSHISAAENVLTMTGLTGNETAYAYKDAGAAHFSDFTHQWDRSFSSQSAYAYYGMWAVTNTLNDLKSLEDANAQALVCYFRFRAASGNQRYALLTECETADTDISAVSMPYDIWLDMDRTDEVATCDIYDDAPRTSNFDTIITTAPSGRTYRYVFGVSSYNDSDADTLTFDLNNLDLQEAGGTVYDETGRIVSVAITTAQTESVLRSETSKAESVAVSTDESDALTLDELGCAETVAVTEDATDVWTAVDTGLAVAVQIATAVVDVMTNAETSRAILVLVTTGETDTLGTEYDETGRAVEVAVTTHSIERAPTDLRSVAMIGTWSAATTIEGEWRDSVALAAIWDDSESLEGVL